jgi:hypothetical protein
MQKARIYGFFVRAELDIGGAEAALRARRKTPPFKTAF